jgi:hypothetical protein
MSVPKTIISCVGAQGEEIQNMLKSQGLSEAVFMTSEQFKALSSMSIFILFLIYDPKEYCMDAIDEIRKVHANNGIVEILLSDKIVRKTPHYIVNKQSIDNAVAEASTIIKTFMDLAKYPSLACVDMTDIKDSLSDVGDLQMSQFIIDSSISTEAVVKKNLHGNGRKKINVVWLQIYIKDDGSINWALPELLDALELNVDSKTDILWNVKFLETHLTKCVLIYC